MLVAAARRSLVIFVALELLSLSLYAVEPRFAEKARRNRQKRRSSHLPLLEACRLPS